MTEQIERVEEAAAPIETAPRERTGYDARAAQERWQAFWEADQTFVARRRRFAPSAGTCWTCSRTRRAICTWATQRRS